MTQREHPISTLTAALRQRRLLLVWADVPFPPAARPPRPLALAINRWQAEASTLPSLPHTSLLPQLPPLPILSLDPTDRLEEAFRQAGVSLHVVRTQKDVPAREQHNLLKLGGDLAARAGLLLSWDDVRVASGDPDKAHLLRETRRLVQDSAVLALAPFPTAAFARLWDELLAPALREANHHFVLGPGDFGWPAPLVRLEAGAEEVLAALADTVIPPPPERLDSLRRQLAEARANLRLIEERETEYVISTDVPLQLVKEKGRWQQRIADLETELGAAGVPTAEAKSIPAAALPPDEIQAIHDKLDRLLEGQEGLRQGQAAIYRRLNAAQRQMVERVLTGLHRTRLDDAESARELRGMLDGVRRALIDLQTRQLPEQDTELRRVLDEVTEVIRADADLRSGLEVTIPLIPLLLDYKFNLDLGGGLDLRQWWENLIAIFFGEPE